MGDRHLVFLCRPSLLAHILAGDLSQMSHKYCPGRAQPLMGTLLWLPGALLFPLFLLSQSASSLFCSLSPKTSPKPLPLSSPSCATICVPVTASCTDTHLGPPLRAVLLWTALTPCLLNGHSEKRVPLNHSLKRPPET